MDKIIVPKKVDAIIFEGDNEKIAKGAKLFCGQCGGLMGVCSEELRFPFSEIQLLSNMKQESVQLMQPGLKHESYGLVLFAAANSPWSFISTKTLEKLGGGPEMQGDKPTQEKPKTNPQAGFTDKIITRHLGCNCDEMYTNRGLADPECSLHYSGDQIRKVIVNCNEAFITWVVQKGYKPSSMNPVKWSKDEGKTSFTTRELFGRFDQNLD